MSSHNSRLAADSYKNCVWTISGEAPEFGAPVSCVRGSAWLLKSAGPGDLRSCASHYLADAQRQRPIPRLGSPGSPGIRKAGAPEAG
ncbi:Hypothetical predicted protein [Lynx pardinus]|uniref:Uncharacterized protein n=1 Tax=Lynx pardinus TaxID=191816 RepID=A0A485MNI0_LYNPA|nr:Hypothetical predicted protein [Lynx pardinus]